LRDLVSYNLKHNDANGENGRDGSPDNRSWNCGIEGPTDNPDIAALRARQQRNFLATLMLSQGTPMLLGGDELGRTQQGNNNPYCQDNEISWVNWEETDDDLTAFVRVLTRLRRDHPVFRRRKFFGSAPEPGAMRDIAWFAPSGQLVTNEEWNAVPGNAVAVFLNGDAISETDARGQRVVDDSFLLLFNASPDDVSFEVPAPPYTGPWQVVLDTATSERDDTVLTARAVQVGARSLCLLRQAR
jgi:glycogen operon protein